MKAILRKRLALLIGLIAACLVLAAVGLLLARWAWLSDGVQLRLPAWRAFITTQFANPSAPQPSPIPPTPAQAAPPPLILSTREAREESQTPRYSIEASWPYLEWASDPRIEPFNRSVQDFVDSEIRAFKNNAASLPDDPAFSEFGSSLRISYTSTYTESGVLSVLMRISFYSAGAAHPGSYFHAFNFNLNQGKEIQLADLFAPQVDFLEPISNYCIQVLRTRNVLAWEEGAFPVPENYRVWNISPQGLLITFDEYQVAPYAAGPQTVTIPYEQLIEIIQKDGPLAAFVSD